MDSGISFFLFKLLCIGMEKISLLKNVTSKYSPYITLTILKRLLLERQGDVMDMSEAVIVKSSRLKSVVWNDFDRIKKGDTFVAVCRHCKKKLSGSSTSGTSHLRNHLIRCQRRSNQFISSSREKKKEATLAITNYVDPGQKKDDVLNLVNIGFNPEKLKEETSNTLSYNFDQRRSCFDLARMIILHGYPLAMVEHVGFRVFVKNLHPLFELVTCNKVETDCLEIYAKEKQKVNELLDKLPGKVSLSADMWTASDHQESAYLCLTAHYIDESWQLNKKVLNFMFVDPSHTEDLHSETIMTCLMDWDIDRKLFSMTFDCSSTSDYISLRIRDRLSQNRFLYCNGQLFDVSCAVDLLNLMAQDALEALCSILPKIRDSIQYIKQSREVQAKFNDMAEQGKVQSQKVVSLDNPAQWNSTYAMLGAAMEYREAFSRLQESEVGYTACPTEEEWSRTCTITGFLKFFFEVTNVLTKSNFPTANIFFPELCDVHLQLMEWFKNSDDYIKALAFKMRTKFEEYWDKCGLALAVSAILDPRFKMKLVEYYYPQIYGVVALQRIDDVMNCVKALYNEHMICSPLASMDEGLAWQVGSSSGKDGRDRLMGFDKFLHEASESEGSKSDLEKYLEEPLFPRNADFNVLNWWKVHSPRYPILSIMARNVLGIPMSKVASDCAFRTGRRVVDREWSSLKPATIEALVCSQDWIRSELES
ncbi:zinc finger BED domain-containing protein RICESLEEPER 1-like isoform X1 [Cucurbita maxima]|uniref:Zinc finger BED domain-containing protein RICESLEEPER 1-like isoform X1 n=2 Tax=Cucurbita maxima TaxID=3661 RepID=A0A6J1JLP2_CUCMA|nr:zinc finger BED domain-containing protein RICESLEEPER 1-like isoform X1 [Cucurbita maxima]